MSVLRQPYSDGPVEVPPPSEIEIIIRKLQDSRDRNECIISKLESRLAFLFGPFPMQAGTPEKPLVHAGKLSQIDDLLRQTEEQQHAILDLCSRLDQL
jgi:hypothetical protein